MNLPINRAVETGADSVAISLFTCGRVGPAWGRPMGGAPPRGPLPKRRLSDWTDGGGRHSP